MSVDLRRFTFYVSPSMKCDLDEVKEEHYSEFTQNEMIRDLITRGLALMDNERTGRVSKQII